MRQSFRGFASIKRGRPTSRANLPRLRVTAGKIAERADQDGASLAYLREAFADPDGTPEGSAIILVTSPRWKLPGFGVALAAEALRNLSLDLCKPDRDILRALGAWSLISFSTWDRRGLFAPPTPKPAEFRAAMLAVRAVAIANDVGVNHANSAIWHAGSVFGMRFTTQDFAALAEGCLAGAQ